MKITDLLKQEVKDFFDLEKLKLSSSKYYSKRFPYEEKEEFNINLVTIKGESFLYGGRVSTLTKSFLQTHYTRKRGFSGDRLTFLLDSIPEAFKEKLTSTFIEFTSLHYLLMTSSNTYIRELRDEFELCFYITRDLDFKLVWRQGSIEHTDSKVKSFKVVDFEDINPIFERYLKANDLEPLN